MSDEPVQFSPEDVVEVGDRLIDGLDSFTRGQVRRATNRRELGSVAAGVTQDRYGAGSTAAAIVLYVLGCHGVQAAEHFVKDLAFHEE